MSLFAFRCWHDLYPRPNSTLVIFAGINEFSSEDVLQVISEQTYQAVAPELVLIIVPNTAKKKLLEIIADASIFAAFSRDTLISLYTYDANGSLSYLKHKKSFQLSRLHLDTIRRQGMTTLFIERGGLIQSGATEHFVKPSKRKDTQFLRASHALSDGAEIFFVAFWLLEYFSDNKIETIHVDTSSIASVAMAVNLLRARFEVGKVQADAAVIRTFHSYDGISKYHLNNKRPEIILISASQSGTLAKEISKAFTEKSRVITLFSTAGIPLDGTSLLCDLTYDEIKNVNGIKKDKKKIAINATNPIRLVGEHFTAAITEIRTIVIKKTDAPDIVDKYIKHLQGNDVFYVYRNVSNNKRRAIWVDVEKIVNNDVFVNWISSVVTLKIPISTKNIIFFSGDKGSSIVSDAILKEFAKRDIQFDKGMVISFDEIEENNLKVDWKIPNSTVLIVGGVTGHGAEFLQASRAMREFAPDSHRIYLTTCVTTATKKARVILGKNLCHGGHLFEPMFELIVNRAAMVDSWKREYELLNGREDDLPQELVLRLNDLKKGSGLKDNLFLPSQTGALKLRENFAFWKDTDYPNCTQADVYATISVILENLRSGEDVSSEQRLSNNTYDRSIIGSENFSRFNDGIIQASLLRSVNPIELNYKDSPADSFVMATFILQMASLADKAQGEALSEFLLALVLDRLILCDDDRIKIVQNIDPTKLSEAQLWLLREIGS